MQVRVRLSVRVRACVRLHFVCAHSCARAGGKHRWWKRVVDDLNIHLKLS